jgi:LCP family protein required for cell wall assembly
MARPGRHRPADGLHALGEQINRSVGPRTVANERGLSELGDQVSASSGPRRRRSGKPRWSLTRKLVTAATGLMVVAAAVTGGAYAYVRYQFNHVPKAACHACVHVVAGRPYNLLVVGSDSRSGDTGQAATSFGTAMAVGGQRSDTIKIFHIDPAAGTVRVLSIPRDTYVSTSGLAAGTGLLGPEKINAAFNNGPEPLIETIQNTFGIPISHWIVINFDGVIDSVRALGGIALDFRYPVRDDDRGVNQSGLAITQTGCQQLNGAQVLSLSRSRFYEYDEGGHWQFDPGSDLSRILRQNIVIEAMIAKAKSTYNPLTLQSLISSVKGNIAIDDKLSLGMIYDLVERYHAFSPSHLQTWSLPTVPQRDTPAGDVELVATGPSDNYVDTITQFLGAAPGPTVTPPLDRDADPIVVPTDTAPAGAPSTSTSSPGSSTTTPSTVATALPAYDPTLC